MPLPQRMTPFEEYFFRDDYPAYPNSITCRLRFKGKIDLSMLQSVGDQVVKRHQMINALVSSDPNLKNLKWIPDPQTGNRTHTQVVPPNELARDQPGKPGGGETGHANEFPIVQQFDLTREPGQRAFVSVHVNDHGQPMTDVILQTHHACCDGLGGAMIINDWMALYHNAWCQANGRDDKKVRLRRYEQPLLAKRGDYGFRSWTFVKKLPRQAIGLAGVWEFLWHRCVPLSENNAADIDGDPPVPHAITRVLTAEQTKKLKQSAADSGTTVNDRLARDLFVAIRHWRETRQLGGDSDWIRLLLPMNVRTMRDRRMSAANRSSFVSLDRKQRDCGATDKLLRSIRDQMNVIVNNELHLTFLLMLRFIKRMPGGLRRVTRPDRRAATCLFTNLDQFFATSLLPREVLSEQSSPQKKRDTRGRILCGDLRLEGYDLLAPLRPFTQAAVAVSRYAGQTQLTLNFDPRVIQDAAAEEFMDHWVGLLSV